MINELIDFIQKNFDIPRQTVATILITLTTFFLGITLNLFITEIKSYVQRRTYRKLSMINYRLLLKGMYKQSINLKKFSDQLDVKHDGAFIYSHTRIPWLDVFNKIGYENLYKAYFKGFENFSFNVSNNKIKIFNTLWATVEFLNNTNTEATN